jgi:hypothetical protein
MGETFDFGKPGLGVSSRSASTVASQRWESALILTGCRRPGKYVVLVHGKEVPLSGALFQALVDLVLALLTSQSGYSHIPSCQGNSEPQRVRLVIHRLRRAISAVCGDSLGQSLIVNGPTTQYRLALNPAQVAVLPSFFELTASHVNADMLERLAKLSAE